MPFLALAREHPWGAVALPYLRNREALQGRVLGTPAHNPNGAYAAVPLDLMNHCVCVGQGLSVLILDHTRWTKDGVQLFLDSFCREKGQQPSKKPADTWTLLPLSKYLRQLRLQESGRLVTVSFASFCISICCQYQHPISQAQGQWRSCSAVLS